MDYPGRNGYVDEAIQLAGRLAGLADRAELDGTDDSCAVLFGIIRDCAYKIKGRAEREKADHMAEAHGEGQV